MRCANFRWFPSRMICHSVFNCLVVGLIVVCIYGSMSNSYIGNRDNSIGSNGFVQNMLQERDIISELPLGKARYDNQRIVT